MTKTLKGIAASDGIAIAPAYLLVEPDLSFKKSSIDDVDSEVSRYQKAVSDSTSEVENIRDVAKKSLGEEEAQKLADKYDMEKEQFLQQFGGIDMVQYDLEMRKTIELLKEANK